MKILLILLVLSVSALADEAVYHDTFSNQQGFKSVNVDGSYDDTFDERTREAHSYMSAEVTGGILSITVHEDATTKGPDDKPGVLALSFDRVPTNAAYSGFVYLGRTGDPITIPLGKDVATNILENVSVSFRYKAANTTAKNVGMTVNCRFEIQVDDAYPSRVDFGDLKATDKWQLFEKKLSAGTNKAAFLKKLNAIEDRTFKMAWGQSGPITNYQDGDTLLLDELVIKMVK